MVRWFKDRSAHTGIPSVSLRRLLTDAWFPGCGDLHVSGCTSDARRLEPGEVFVAVDEGHDDVDLALERGAAAVVVERPSPEAGRLQVVVPDTRRALGRLAHALAGDPSEHLRLSAFCGSTGTDAASTFLRSILEAAGQRVGLLGASEWSDGQSRYPLRTSEPSSPDLAGLLGRMIDRRCASALVCLSRTAVARGSAESLKPSEAVILNVRAPGLDPDQVRDSRRAFAKLARSVIPTGSVIVYADDPDAEILGGVHLDARRIAFSFEREADVSGTIERLDSEGSRLRIHGFDREILVDLRPSGRLAAEAALAASAAAWSRGIPVETVIEGLEAVERLSGRLERLSIGDGVDVRLESPRSSADLARALTSMRAWVPGTLTCLLSARVDEERESALRSTAERFADRVVLSAPESGLPDQAEEDFRLAPKSALEFSLKTGRPGDGLLILGGPHWSIVADQARRSVSPVSSLTSQRRSA